MLYTRDRENLGKFDTKSDEGIWDIPLTVVLTGSSTKEQRL
jgi:hypothetical protein